MRMVGVYAITNLTNGEFYIGSSINMLGRRKSHFVCLRKGSHHSWKLQRAFNQVGEESLDFSVLEELEHDIDRECLHMIEQVYINELNPQYNVALEVFGCVGGTRSKEWIVYDPTVQEEIVITGLKEFCVQRGLTYANLVKVANGEISQHKGYMCRRPGTIQYPFVRSLNTGRPESTRTLQGTYKMTHPNGEIEVITNLNAFCRLHGLNRDTMRGAMRRGGKHRGFMAERLHTQSTNLKDLTT